MAASEAIEDLQWTLDVLARARRRHAEQVWLALAFGLTATEIAALLGTSRSQVGRLSAAGRRTMLLRLGLDSDIDDDALLTAHRRDDAAFLP